MALQYLFSRHAQMDIMLHTSQVILEKYWNHDFRQIQCFAYSARNRVLVRCHQASQGLANRQDPEL